jgi:transposase InsO family protein
VPFGEAATRHVALSADTTRRRRFAYSGHRYPGQPVWPLRLSPDHGAVATGKVIEVLADVMMMKGVPEHIRSDYGPEFVVRDLRKWLADTGAKTLYIQPGSPWENAY